MVNIRLLIICISSPMLIGIYENEKLLETICKDGKTSDILPSIFAKLLLRFDIKEILYTNGPGSYMAIKLTYIFLKTINIVNNIPLKGIDSFLLNNNSPIKALGRKYFIKDKNNNITIDNLDINTKISSFKLPNNLDLDIGLDDNLPSYHIAVVNY